MLAKMRNERHSSQICTIDVCSIFQYQQHAHLPFPEDPALCLVQFLDVRGRLYYPAVPVKTLSHHLPSLKLTSPEAVPCQVLPMDLIGAVIINVEIGLVRGLVIWGCISLMLAG